MQDNIFGDIIHAYTRADAIADGVLHDVSHLARETGFHHPVAVAAHAWDRTVTWDHDDTSQDETGRLWDVLTVALAAFRRAVAAGRDTAPMFAVHRVTIPGGQPQSCDLWIDFGPGDDGSPVFTITHRNDN